MRGKSHFHYESTLPRSESVVHNIKASMQIGGPSSHLGERQSPSNGTNCDVLTCSVQTTVTIFPTHK